MNHEAETLHSYQLQEWVQVGNCNLCCESGHPGAKISASLCRLHAQTLTWLGPQRIELANACAPNAMVTFT